jgi:hypothetical protein
MLLKNFRMLDRKVTICPEKCSISGKLTVCPEKPGKINTPPRRCSFVVFFKTPARPWNTLIHMYSTLILGGGYVLSPNESWGSPQYFFHLSPHFYQISNFNSVTLLCFSLKGLNFDIAKKVRTLTQFIVVTIFVWARKIFMQQSHYVWGRSEEKFGCHQFAGKEISVVQQRFSLFVLRSLASNFVHGLYISYLYI